VSATPAPVGALTHAVHRQGTSWVQARERAHTLGRSLPTPTVSIQLAEATGFVLRDPVRSRTSLPPHAASAMDGWVVAGDPPWLIGAPIDAGDTPDRTPLIAGTARPICTGAPLPPGAVGVLRLENGDEHSAGASARSGRVVVRGERARPDEPRPGEHVRAAAEEAKEGELLIASGSVLTPPRIALAAAGGYDVLRVAAAPGVDLLVLGDELAASGVPRTGRIRDIVTPAFPALLATLGARVSAVSRAADDRRATAAAMAASEAAVLIATGGSSRGRTDHARAAAESLGVRWEVDGVAMRPGHPVAFGCRPDGRIVLLLPGNPLAAVAGLLSFGTQLLGGMLGLPPSRLAQVPLAETVSGHHGDTRLVAVAIQHDGAHALAMQGSGMLRGLAAADGLAVVHPGSGATGETVPMLPLPW